MIQIRRFSQGDLEQIADMDRMLWMQIQWNQSFHHEDAFVAFEDEKVLGMAALAYDGTWYYLDRDVNHIPEYRMQINYAVKKECLEEYQVKCTLFEALKEHMKQWKSKYPDKTVVMRCWCEDTELEEMEFLLEQGFTAEGVTMVLKYDLSKEIPSYPIPEEVKVGIHDFNGEGMKRYLTANEAGYDNVQDSEEELRFRLGGEKTKVFTACVKEQVVASTTTWEIGDGRSATENVFTIPGYRRRNIGAETLCTALRQLQEDGESMATLTVLGGNLPAIQMYLKIGYQLYYNMIEMHFTL